ncbi:MAG: hypothetical protein BWY87_01541 [Deltaproteobacteria bacterium ADurb.Bin510]|nr:MAG: hypothetical protein BWY87_01541 [Deltaproteobacteria bacterium ADurb.Bin510]
MLLHVFLDLVPVALVVADLLAAGADRHDAAQGADLAQGLLQFFQQAFLLGVFEFLLVDVAADAHQAGKPAGGILDGQHVAGVPAVLSIGLFRAEFRYAWRGAGYGDLGQVGLEARQLVGVHQLTVVSAQQVFGRMAHDASPRGREIGELAGDRHHPEQVGRVVDDQAGAGLGLPEAGFERAQLADVVNAEHQALGLTGAIAQRLEAQFEFEAATAGAQVRGKPGRAEAEQRIVRGEQLIQAPAAEAGFRQAQQAARGPVEFDHTPALVQHHQPQVELPDDDLGRDRREGHQVEAQHADYQQDGVGNHEEGGGVEHAKESEAGQIEHETDERDQRTGQDQAGAGPVGLGRCQMGFDQSDEPPEGQAHDVEVEGVVKRAGRVAQLGHA